MGNLPSTILDTLERIPPIVSINCGSATEGHTSTELVRISGTSYAENDPINQEISAENQQYAAMGRSHRWGPGNFTFNIAVPVPGEYDVTLVFCETYSGVFGVGYRVFDVAIQGVEEHYFKDVDVFAAVGPNKVHTISVQNVKAEEMLQVHVRKGRAQDGYISGIIIGAVENPSIFNTRPLLGETTVSVSQAQYDECIRKIDEYIVEKKIDPPAEVRNTPTFMFHSAGTPVRGLVITYHGFSNYPYDHRIIGRYLYDEGYDVVHAILAGHYYNGDQWPTTKLSQEYGGGTIPQAVFKNPELRGLLENTRTDPSKIPVLINRLIQLEPNFERVVSAQTYMASLDRDEDPNFARFFDSNHRDYATEGSKYLRMCETHPGPIHLMGLSVGGTVALAVAALHPERVERCIAMAPLLELWEQYPNTQRSLVNYIGPLEVAPKFGWNENNPFPVSAFTAAGRFGGSLTSSKKYQSVFKTKQVQMFMVLTENEDAADIPTNKKFFRDCGGRSSGHHLFTYPFNYEVPHPLLDPTASSRNMSNKYYKPLYQQFLQFLSTGDVNNTSMFRETAESHLPTPPRAVPDDLKYYATADQVGDHNRYGL